MVQPHLQIHQQMIRNVKHPLGTVSIWGKQCFLKSPSETLFNSAKMCLSNSLTWCHSLKLMLGLDKKDDIKTKLQLIKTGVIANISFPFQFPQGLLPWQVGRCYQHNHFFLVMFRGFYLLIFVGQLEIQNKIGTNKETFRTKISNIIENLWLLIVIILHLNLPLFSPPCQKFNCSFHSAQASSLQLQFPSSRKKISFSLLTPTRPFEEQQVLTELLCFPWQEQQEMRRDTLRCWAVLVALMGLGVAEDFPWTKNNPGSFYYGTFPAGTSQPQLLWGLGCSRSAPVFAQGRFPCPSREMAGTEMEVAAEWGSAVLYNSFVRWEFKGNMECYAYAFFLCL